MRCVANCTILLESNIVHINTMKNSSIGVSIDGNDCIDLKPLYKPYQAVTLCGCINFCKAMCEFSEPQI